MYQINNLTFLQDPKDNSKKDLSYYSLNKNYLYLYLYQIGTPSTVT